MFKNNPITKLELDYLRQIAPHRWWHFLLMLPVFATASLPLFHRFHRSNGMIVLVMAIIIVGTYWLIQFRAMLLARKITQHDFKTELPDELIGTITNRQIVMGRLWAILRHQWAWYILITITLLGLSLAVMGWEHRVTQWGESLPSRGLIEYVGLQRNARIYGDFYSTSYLPHIYQLVMAFTVLVILVIIHVILVTLMSFSIKSLRVFAIQSTMVASAFFILTLVHDIENKNLVQYMDEASFVALECRPNSYNRTDSRCREWQPYLTLVRIVESIQATMTVFIDSGVVLVTSLLCPFENGYNTNNVGYISSIFYMTGFMYRHLLAAGLAGLIQLTLSGVFLRYAIRHANSKKAKEN